MSLRAIPMISIAFILYNIIVLFAKDSPPPVPVTPPAQTQAQPGTPTATTPAEVKPEAKPADAGGERWNAATRLMHQPLLRNIPLPPGEKWTMTIGDLLMLVTLMLLFVELLKSTYTSTASLLDHGLSMLVFVACLVEFIIVPNAATSVFFFITIATLIDVIAGYTIGIRVARRDLSIGGAGS